MTVTIETSRKLGEGGGLDVGFRVDKIASREGMSKKQQQKNKKKLALNLFMHARHPK